MLSALFAVIALTLTVLCFKWKDILLSYAAGITWLGFGFWWILGGTLALGDPWTQFFVFVPFVMFCVVMLRLMNTEIQMEDKGVKWMETGGNPKRKALTRYENYREALYKRTRR